MSCPRRRGLLRGCENIERRSKAVSRRSQRNVSSGRLDAVAVGGFFSQPLSRYRVLNGDPRGAQRQPSQLLFPRRRAYAALPSASDTRMTGCSKYSSIFGGPKGGSGGVLLSSAMTASQNWCHTHAAGTNDNQPPTRRPIFTTSTREPRSSRTGSRPVMDQPSFSMSSSIRARNAWYLRWQSTISTSIICAR